MKVTVIGCGRWGSLIAWYLNKIKHEVTLYGRISSKHMQEFIETRSNGTLVLPQSINLSTSLNNLKESDVIVISINSQGLRNLMNEISALNLQNKLFVICMKGLEIESGKRLSEIVSEYVDNNNSVSIWVGPGHVQEIYNNIPTCMVIDSNNKIAKEKLVNAFTSELIRFYYGEDLLGNEIGAAAKNVIGIAAGMLDGLNLSPLKGPLMARGTREIANLIYKMGGNELSAYGLSHLGDYQATVFSQFSHNRLFGEKFIKKEEYSDLAEGYYTVKALMILKEKYQVDLPICQAVYNVLYKNCSPIEEINSLFLRETKSEYKK